MHRYISQQPDSVRFEPTYCCRLTHFESESPKCASFPRPRILFVCKRNGKKEGVDETLKAKDQMAWVQAMNSILSCAEEIVLSELIYGEGTV